MPIQPTDIKLLESERMRDTSDGGGRMTGNIIPSGQAGNVFPKVSRVDSVYGRVNLRKIYIAVRTATLEMYAGAHAIITDPPNNDRISCVLFSTGSAFDTRAAARDRIESYVVAGPFSRLRLYGNQLVGQKAILCYQREEEPLPDVGEVLVLSVEAQGYPATQQYVRITDVTHEVRIFTDAQGDYRQRVLALKIGAPLAQTFPGAEPVRVSTDPSPTKVRGTQVADASKYYGIQPIDEAVTAGALTLRLSSIYAALVPSTQRETPVSLAQIGGAVPLERTGDVIHEDAGQYTFSRFNINTGGGIRTKSKRPINAGTLLVEYRDPATGSLHVRFTDTGNGVLAGEEFVAFVGVSGTVNYETGDIHIWAANGASDLTHQVRLTYAASVPVSNPAHSRQIPITLGTRGTVYAETLLPIPSPGTLVVDFRALGRWYRLRDNGSGQLIANTQNEGTGSVDYVTGAVVVTLGALPDVDSAVLFAWGSPVHTVIRAGATTDATTTLRLDYRLANAPVVPGTVTISYPVGGLSCNVTDSGAAGNLAGTGVSGTINYTTGDVRLEFSTPPDRAAHVLNAYTWRSGAGLLSGTTAVISGGSFTVPGTAPFRNGGTMTLTATDSAGTLTLPAYITAGGQVRVRAFRDGPNHASSTRWIADQQVGTFAADTGVVTLTSAVSVQTRAWGEDMWVLETRAAPITGAADIVVEHDTETYDPNAVTGEAVAVSAVGLTLDLTTTVADMIVPGSVLFRATGKSYADRNGTLYADVDPATGSGTPAGTLDYATGVAHLTFWADNAAVNRAVDACLTQYGNWTSVTAFFRTAGSPIRPASLYVQAATTDGELISGTANQNGEISGSWMRGTVEQTMGVVAVEFGQMQDGAWVPREIMPGTLRYNCVVLSNLPLDANVLGLDPVRLPSDGRVPIYRPGDVVVIHNTQETALPNPVTAGASYSVGRTNLAVLRLEDALGVELAADRYVGDLAAGTVTMASDWDGTGVAHPLVAVHRIEDMSLLADVQINGEISLTAPTLHAYPQAGTYVSSALLYGDLAAIVTNLFDQQTWTGAWSDSLIGSQSNAQYDDINYPVEVLNESAVTERWRINFTSTTAFQLYGENLGLIATGEILIDLAPINPVTGQSYFVLRAAGWGGGWAAGNQLRFNTIGANGPTWIARTILAGASLAGDSFDIEARGDVD